MKEIVIKLINIYQRVFSFDRGILFIFAPGGACKYPVFCSEYTKMKVMEYGVIRGGWMGVKRIWGCR